MEYAAIAFWEDLPMENRDSSSAQFSEAQGQVLVKLARKTIMNKLESDSSEPASDRPTFGPER